MATHLFQTLIRDVESELWNEHELAKLPLLELQSLADLLACARSGTKEEVTTKILAIRTIRLRLSGFADDPQAVAAVFDRRALRQMCREACLWRSGNKRQLAAVLLTWRNRCRHEGAAPHGRGHAGDPPSPEATRVRVRLNGRKWSRGAS